MPDLPRVNISYDADIFWIRMEKRTTNPDNANATDRFNFAIVNDVLTWVDSLGNVFTAAAGGSGVTSFNSRTGAVVPAEADYTLTLLGDVSAAAQTANFVMAAGDGSSGGDYRGRALVAADIPSLAASKITAGTFSAGAYIFEHATATATPLSLKSTDNSLTNPLIRGLDSSNVSRWGVDYDGGSRWGRTSGGTNNGNITIAMHDTFPAIRYRSGTTTKVELSANVSTGNFSFKADQTDFYDLSSNLFIRANNNTKQIYFGGLTAALNSATVTINTPDAATNTVSTVVALRHDTSDTPAAGFGGAIDLLLESATNGSRDAASIEWLWNIATDATRVSDLAFYANYQGSAVEGVRIRGNSSTTTALGFFGVAPVAKPTVTGSRGGNAALASLLTELANLGLIVDSSSA